MKTLAIVGAGSRGLGVYAEYAARFPDRFRVVAVAEPRSQAREATARRHDLPPEACFSDWRELLQARPQADALVLATQDRDHLEPALEFMAAGYDLLLEKPMDVSAAGCLQLQQASRRHARLLVVAHVLRYTHYFQTLKRLSASGMLGQPATLRHLEPVLYWHQAHSFVRGNWRNSHQSAPMILAKSCHDLDMLCHLAGETPARVSSFGRLSHFRPENRPLGAADRCLDCSLADHGCAYSAKRFYLGLVEQGQTGWPVDVLSADTSAAGVTRALRDGPYGRCVYACDNDVVDHQVVAVEFSSGLSATFTMTAFTAARNRETEILGSLGQLVGDGSTIRYTPFGDVEPHWLTGSRSEPDGSYLWDFRHISSAGHGGGDDGLMEFLHDCLENREAALQRSLPEEALRGHLLCFAAETARLEGRVVTLPETDPPWNPG